MVMLQPQAVHDIVNALTFKANADREAARKCMDPQSGEVPEGLRQLHDELIAQASREDQLAEWLLDESLAEVQR